MQVLLDGQDIEQVKHLNKQVTEHGNAYARYAEDAFIERLHRNYKLFSGKPDRSSQCRNLPQGENSRYYLMNKATGPDMFLYF